MDDMLAQMENERETERIENRNWEWVEKEAQLYRLIDRQSAALETARGRIAELEAEGAKLRTEAGQCQALAYTFRNELIDAREDNDKAREDNAMLLAQNEALAQQVARMDAEAIGPDC